MRFFRKKEPRLTDVEGGPASSPMAQPAPSAPGRAEAPGTRVPATLGDGVASDSPAPPVAAAHEVPHPAGSGGGVSVDPEAPPGPAERKRTGLLGRLRNALRRTGSGLVEGVTGLFAGGRTVDASLIDELETLLLSADLGIDATDRILGGLSSSLKRRELRDAAAVITALKRGMLEILEPVEVPLAIAPRRGTPFVILMVGVNGAGKTTTIGKLAQRYQREGHRVMLAAGDTFRAAAVEQLQAWGERHRVPVVAQRPGADSASVAYDALESATARGYDVLLVDTAGRLHTQGGLMQELSKVRRVLSKRDPEAPHEVLLVLDAGTGQNAIVQAAQFKDAVNVSGIALTKLDGTAKGGVIFSIAERLGLPIRFIGVGEKADDLREFRAREFVDALFAPQGDTPE